MKLFKSSEWFDLKEPIGEPNVKWSHNEYCIERRIQKANDVVEIVWYGWETNWKYCTGEGWVKLVDMQWIPCEEPVYETLYQELLKEKK